MNSKTAHQPPLSPYLRSPYSTRSHGSARKNLKVYDQQIEFWQRAYAAGLESHGSHGVPQYMSNITSSLRSLSSILNATDQDTHRNQSKGAIKSWRARETKVTKSIKQLDTLVADALQKGRLTRNDAYALLQNAKDKITIRFNEDSYVKENELQKEYMRDAHRFLDMRIHSYSPEQSIRKHSKPVRQSRVSVVNRLPISRLETSIDATNDRTEHTDDFLQSRLAHEAVQPASRSHNGHSAETHETLVIVKREATGAMQVNGHGGITHNGSNGSGSNGSDVITIGATCIDEIVHIRQPTRINGFAHVHESPTAAPTILLNGNNGNGNHDRRGQLLLLPPAPATEYGARGAMNEYRLLERALHAQRQRDSLAERLLLPRIEQAQDSNTSEKEENAEQPQQKPSEPASLEPIIQNLRKVFGPRAEINVYEPGITYERNYDKYNHAPSQQQGFFKRHLRKLFFSSAALLAIGSGIGIKYGIHNWSHIREEITSEFSEGRMIAKRIKKVLNTE